MAGCAVPWVDEVLWNLDHGSLPEFLYLLVCLCIDMLVYVRHQMLPDEPFFAHDAMVLGVISWASLDRGAVVFDVDVRIGGVHVDLSVVRVVVLNGSQQLLDAIRVFFGQVADGRVEAVRARGVVSFFGWCPLRCDALGQLPRVQDLVFLFVHVDRLVQARTCVDGGIDAGLLLDH